MNTPLITQDNLEKELEAVKTAQVGESRLMAAVFMAAADGVREQYPDAEDAPVELRDFLAEVTGTFLMLFNQAQRVIAGR